MAPKRGRKSRPAGAPKAAPAGRPGAASSPTVARTEPGSAVVGIWIVRLAALWVLAGAVAKALTGTPAELPSPILSLDIDPFVVIAVAVVVETLVAIVALVSPRRGCVPLALLLGVFVVVLILHIRAGGEHCGCFGGAMAIPAWVMLAIDAALLVGVVGGAICGRNAAPRAPSNSLRRVGVAASIGLAAGLGLGWHASARLEPLRPREAGPSPGVGTTAALPSGAFTVASSTDTPAPAWQLPQTIPDQVILRPLQWVGKRLADTELGRWTDTSAFPPDATLIIYYLSCNHCAAHLRELADLQDAAPEKAPNYVLVQLPTPPGYTGRLFVDRVPRGVHVVLPAQVKAYVITPPWDVFVKGGVVAGAERVKWSGETGG